MGARRIVSGSKSDLDAAVHPLMQMMRSHMMGILADTGLGGRMLLTFVASHGDDSFDMRPPLTDEDGPAYRQQDKAGKTNHQSAQNAVMCTERCCYHSSCREMLGEVCRQYLGVAGDCGHHLSGGSCWHG